MKTTSLKFLKNCAFIALCLFTQLALGQPTGCHPFAICNLPTSNAQMEVTYNISCGGASAFTNPSIIIPSGNCLNIPINEFIAGGYSGSCNCVVEVVVLSIGTCVYSGLPNNQAAVSESFPSGVNCFTCYTPASCTGVISMNWTSSQVDIEVQ